MAISYVQVPERDFSSGTDARSAENQIDPGFVRDLLNADIVEKRARKRKGYQGFAGNSPVRVVSVEYKTTATDNICFILDGAVDLSQTIDLLSVRSSPIIAYGRTSALGNPSNLGRYPSTNSNGVYWYPGFTTDIRKVFVASAGLPVETISIPNSEHGLGTDNLFVQVAESLSTSTLDNKKVLWDTININESTFDISVDYQNSTGSDKQVFVYYTAKDAEVGSVYISPNTSIADGATTTITITQGTHQLSSFSIVPRVYQDNGGNRDIVEPDSLTLNQSTGQVDVTITNNTGSSQDYFVILSAVDTANILQGSVAGLDTDTITIPEPDRPFIFEAVYLEQTPGGTLELVDPDEIEFNTANDEITITFTNSNSTARNFIVYWEYATVRSSQICVTDPMTIGVGFTDDNPQLTLWGLDHQEIYGTAKTFREGWVTHVDSYRRSGEQRLVSGLGGNIFTAREYSENGSSHLYGSAFPSLFSRTASPLILGPLFWDTAETPERTRGYITSDNSGSNMARVSAVEFDTGNGWTKYTLDLPNKQILDSTGSPTSLASVISVASELEDWLTVSDMSYARHSGTFRIMQVTDGTDQIFVWVENENNSSDYDDDGVGGEAGVFTDQFVWTAASPYIADDTLLSNAVFGNTIVSTVLSSSGSTTVADGIVDRIEVAAGLLFTGARTSSVIPLRNSSDTATVSNYVRGDMVSYTDIDRLLRVLFVNPVANITVDVSGDGAEATVTLGSGDTNHLSTGQKVLLRFAGDYTGVQTITDVPTETTFTFESEETSSVVGATLVGYNIQVDEELSWKDTISDSQVIRVEERWITAEAPDDSFDLTPSTYGRHLDSNFYAAQPFLRSTMLADNMYFTNGFDEVYKLDGTNAYRSGIIPWQPGLFLTQETTGAVIVTSLRSVAYSAISATGGALTVTAADLLKLPVGSSVRLTGSSQTYTIRDYDSVNNLILLDRSLDSGVSATGTAAEIGTFRYYYRLNAVDANDNVVASAVAGFQDHVVELTGDAAIRHKIVGLPAWDVYDYDRLELQIYRTKINQAAPFYRVTTLAMDFDNTQGYITYRDSFADTDLTELDEVNTALKGAELGTAWSDPLRANYITSIGNRLVLGNFSDYPQLDIQVIADATVSNSTFAGDTLLFRRDNTDTATTTDMVDRVKYEWINGFSGTPASITIGTNEFTVTGITQPVVAGDWIYLTYATVATTGRDLALSGWWQIESVAGAGPYDATINFVGVTAPSSSPNRYVVATDPTDVPVLLGVDGNLGMVNGDSFDVFDAMRRMSMAINSSMRMVDTSVSGMSLFKPWLTARSGNDTPPAGRLIVRQPRADDFTFEMLPTFSGYDVFVNSIKRTTSTEISASTKAFPSRILVSYENYPEIFDNPTPVLDVDSDSAIDINPADGQQITGIIPFFGEAAFGAAQQSSILVVFKTNSIYLVDINQKAQGFNAVQRIETEGLGCTAPYSISVTKNGIMFANESGVYCLRRNQSIQYIGRFMERNWTEKVDLTNLGLVQGHHYGVGRVYKISVPLIEDINATTGYIENSEAYVYNHTAESEGGLGAWSRYDNHPAIGWANLAEDAFFASAHGRVFSIRRTGTTTDFRDDNEAITMRLDTRANDFGNSGIRKVIDRITVHYRTPTRSVATSVSYALDLESEFSSTNALIVPKADVMALNGTSDQVAKDIVSISSNVGRRRCVYFQIRVENSGIDESIEVAGIDFKVGGLSDMGILEAAQTLSR